MATCVPPPTGSSRAGSREHLRRRRPSSWSAATTPDWSPASSRPRPTSTASERRAVAVASGDPSAVVAACDDDVDRRPGLRLRAARRSRRSDRVRRRPDRGRDRALRATRLRIPARAVAVVPARLLHALPARCPTARRPLRRTRTCRRWNAGTSIHETLDRFHRRVIAGEIPQPGPDGWSAGATASPARDRSKRPPTSSNGRVAPVGRPTGSSNVGRSATSCSTGSWPTVDAPRNAGAEVVHSELRFGYDDADVTLPLADGRRSGGRPDSPTASTGAVTVSW